MEAGATLYQRASQSFVGLCNVVRHQSGKVAATPIITILALAYSFWRGYLSDLPDRLSVFDSWQIGDWLIDYSGGMVRRGLTGEVFLTLVPEGSDPIALVVVTQTCLAATLFVLVGVLYWRTSRGPVWMMLVLSPAFMLFPALSAEGNSRKELLVLVALAIVALGARAPQRATYSLIAFPIFCVGVVSHEALVVTLPAFIYLFLTSQPTRRTWGILIAYCSVAALSVTLALFRPGSPQIVEAVCHTWSVRGISDCGGALAALGTPLASSAAYLFDYHYPLYWGYLLPAALALLPFFLLRFNQSLGLATAVVIISLVPLFFTGWDYGRWIFLGTAQLSLIALARWNTLRPMQVPLIWALAYILLWGMSHVDQPLSEGLMIRWMSSVFG